MADLTNELRALRELRLQRDEAVAKGKELAAEYDAEQWRLIDLMDEHNTTSQTTDGIQFTRKSTPMCKVTDREAFIEWANQEDEALVEPRERKAVLNQLVRDRIDNGQDLPPGLDFYTKDVISQRKVNNAPAPPQV